MHWSERLKNWHRRAILGALIGAVVLLTFVGRTANTGSLRWPQAAQALGAYSMSVQAWKGSPSTRMKWGGVAFGGVATPARAGVVLDDIRYDPTRADGQRWAFVLTTPEGVKAATAPFGDWQLVPIARVVGDDSQGMFSLFGHLSDLTEEEALRKDGFEILAYHRQLVDTLFGLRMAQADILVLTPYAGDLPRYQDVPYLGFGEQAPDVAANHAALSQLAAAFTEPFQSYLICDEGQTVGFDVSGSELILTGQPFWYFWRYTAAADAQSTIESANEQAYLMFVDEWDRDQSRLSTEEFNAKYSVEYQLARQDELFDEIVGTTLITDLPALSARVSTRVAELGGINPAVYSALANAMRFQAFFRHFRLTHSERYGALLAELKSVTPAPPIHTPGAYRQHGELILTDEAFPTPTHPGIGGAGNFGGSTASITGGTTAATRQSESTATLNGGTAAVTSTAFAVASGGTAAAASRSEPNAALGGGTAAVTSTALTVASGSDSNVGSAASNGGATSNMGIAASIGGSLGFGNPTSDVGGGAATPSIRSGGASNGADNVLVGSAAAPGGADAGATFRSSIREQATSAGSPPDSKSSNAKQGQNAEGTSDNAGCGCHVAGNPLRRGVHWALLLPLLASLRRVQRRRRG